MDRKGRIHTDPVLLQAVQNSERSAFRKLEASGLPVYWLPYETAYEKVFKTFARADAEGDALAA
jgi:hypothetical protein